jgi:hypothetical protein
MHGSGKEGNNWGKPPKNRGREADSRRFQGQESGRSSSGAERPAGRSQGTRQGPNEVFRENSSRKRAGRVSNLLFRGFEKNPVSAVRPKWTPPQVSAEPIPHPLCPYCGKPIKDIAAAMTDKDTGQPVHFDCAAARIAEGETLENGDAVVYIGGGRFALVHFPGVIRDALHGRGNGDGCDTRDFRIKKIFEWEDKEHRAPWRKNIEDHFSVV